MTLSLKPFDRGKARTREQAMQDIKGYNPATLAADNTQTQRAFAIEDLNNRYRLSNVPYRAELWAFDWYKQLLLEEKKLNHDQWIERTRTNSIKLPNTQMVYACIAALYANRDNPAQKTLVEKVLEEIFKPDIMKHVPHTSTRIAYQPTGQDKVIHNLGYADQYTIDEDIVGPNAWVDANSGLEKPIWAILGTTNLAEVEQVYEWISAEKPFLSVQSSKPKHEELRAVVFGINNSRFDVVAYGSIYGNGLARGVVARRMEELQK